MKISMIVCFVFAGIYAQVSLSEPFMVSSALFFGILGVMFRYLVHTPKKSRYMYFNGYPYHVKKRGFVLLFVILAFAVLGIIMGWNLSDRKMDAPAAQRQSQGAENASARHEQVISA